MSAVSLFNRYSNSGFYKASVSKVLLGSVIGGHIALQVPMFASLQKYLICKFPDSIMKGEAWRLLSSKIAFIDTKDTMFIALLIYYFRIFERRLGSRKFSSQLLATCLLSTILECFISSAFVWYTDSEYSGILAVGPIGLVFPWFIAYYRDIPKLSSSTFGGFSVSAKSLTYLLGLQVVGSSPNNAIAALAGIIAGLLYRQNFLWLQNWCKVPVFVANGFDRVFGWLVNSGSPDEGMMGATLEIQRTQQMEALEAQMIRAQTRQAAARQRQMRHQMGQGFAERLVDEGWGAQQRIRQDFGAAPPAAAVQPTEENIQLLMDMGFGRQQVVRALHQTNNDVQMASTILIQQA